MSAFRVGTEAFIVANGIKVRPVRIVSVNSGFYTLRFLDGSGVTRLKKGRLYKTKEDAEDYIKNGKPKVRRYRSPYSYGYY